MSITALEMNSSIMDSKLFGRIATMVRADLHLQAEDNYHHLRN